MGRTDHSDDIQSLRNTADLMQGRVASTRPAMMSPSLITRVLAIRVAADLLEVHDDTGISLDNWPNPRALIEHLLGHAIQENGV